MFKISLLILLFYIMQRIQNCLQQFIKNSEQGAFVMKIQVQKDLELSQMRISNVSNFLVQGRLQNGKKVSRKVQQTRKKQSQKLKSIINKEKVSEIKKQFIRRLKMLVPHKIIPTKLSAFRKQPINLWDVFILKLQQKQGFKIGSNTNFIWKFTILLKVIIIIVVLSFLLAFKQAEQHIVFLHIIQFSILIGFIDIFMNFTFQRFENNKHIKKMLNIAKSYTKNDFIIDFSILILNISLRFAVDYTLITLLLILNLVKLFKSFNRIQVLEHAYFSSLFHEKYYTIGRVIFFNYMIAHFIGIIAILMAKFDDECNWLIKKQIQDKHWFQQYIWGVYWAVNIMLTVGFGDISATNKYQAIVLIFVQTFSCIMLAYNINIVGSILADMKQKERQRKNQLRILLKISQDHEINPQVFQQAVNYVDQSFKIKQKFLYQEHDQIIRSLPDTLQEQYIRQTNRKMLLDLPLVNLFSRKSLLKIALKINRKLAHPQQIIWKKGQPLRLIILNKGKLGLTYRKQNSTLNGKIIQQLQIKSKNSKLLSMNFLRNQKFTYDLKSINYSIVYHLSNQELGEALTEKNTDYQLFCCLKDKNQFRLESGQIYQCQFCPEQKHDYFNCPKMHLILIPGHVVYKYIFCKKNIESKRQYFIRKKNDIPILKYRKLIKTQQQQFTQVYFSKKQATKRTIDAETVGLGGDNIFSNKTTSIRSNIPSNVFRDLDIQRINTFLVAKMNEQVMYVGFWDVECDAAYNWNTYFRSQNSEYLNINNRQPSLNGYRKFYRSNTISLAQFC